MLPCREWGRSLVFNYEITQMGLERKKDSAPSGPKPPKEKPKAKSAPRARPAPAPTTPEKAREGIAGVRANAEAIFKRLDYYAKVAFGDIPPELMRANTDARLNLRKIPKKGLRFDRDYLVPLHERMRSHRKKKKPLKEAIAKGLDDNRRFLRARQIEAMFVATGLRVKIGDTQAIAEARRKFCEIIPDDLPSSKEEQLHIAQNVIQQFDSSADPEYVRTVIVDLEKQEDDAVLFERALQEEQVAQAFAEQSVAIDDPEKAFAEALKKGSPELQKAYDEYLAFWNSESVADVIAPLMPEILNVSLETASEVQTRAAVSEIHESGVTIHMGSQNYGEVHFGTLVRPCALYAVNGEPKLFIYDRNADRGVRGPIDPTEVRAELAHALMDEYFSEQFRHFAGAGSEVDPQKIADAKLFKIVHAFLPPGSDEHMDRLDATQHKIIRNLAILFATPDSTTHISLENKARFLEAQIISQPDRLAMARRWLQENDLTSEKLTFSEFAFKMNLHI